MRHPFELGGLAFPVSMLWAQIFPFVALTFYDNDDNKEAIMLFLACSFTAWLLANIIFFCTIDSSYLHTFFGTMTGPQYACERFLDAEGDDEKRWSAAFENRISYKDTIKVEMTEWVANNIDRWKDDKPDWFRIEKIPDEFLPRAILEAEGGVGGRRRSVDGLSTTLGLG